MAFALTAQKKKGTLAITYALDQDEVSPKWCINMTVVGLCQDTTFQAKHETIGESDLVEKFHYFHSQVLSLKVYHVGEGHR